MNWKHDLEALIESAMTFRGNVKHEPISGLAVALKSAEQALIDTPKPVASVPMSEQAVVQRSEREEIQQRVTNFKAHQEKIAREREDYYLQIRRRMMAAFVSPKKNPPA
jgi:hypothetical protein